MDNVSTNNTLTNVLVSYLSDINMDWDSKQYCIHCFGYIINLIALVFIYIDLKNMFAANNAIG